MACFQLFCCFPVVRTNFIFIRDQRVQKWYVGAISKKKASEDAINDSKVDEQNQSSSGSRRRTPRLSRKKIALDTPEEDSSAMSSSIAAEETVSPDGLSEEVKKAARKNRKKASPSMGLEEENFEKKSSRRRTRRSTQKAEEHNMFGDLNDSDDSKHLVASNAEIEESLSLENGEDISETYSWPPLVCCFGAPQYSFIPSGRPANRLIDQEIHELKKDMFWAPTKFVRAPGSSVFSVAVALASFGGRVAFMGKIGDDEYGQSMLYHLNINQVQTRSVKIDSLKDTAVSHMKISKRGGLRVSCVRPCAEDSLLSSEINIDVLKEAKMFYFNSSSLLDPSMRKTTMQAVKASKKLGGMIFFDLNLPLPLWNSSEETKKFIWQAWSSADIIEVTKQELEFICGITPSEKFDTMDNEKSKFLHYKPEVVKPLWHDNLKILFVTNGTSKIHFYTEKDNGSVHGMEDAPITPFTVDMSASGDAIVAALMRMITVQMHLVTDKGYIEHMIKYAINCGVIDQWSLARIRGFPPKQSMELSSSGTGRVRSITEREYRTVGPSGIRENM